MTITIIHIHRFEFPRGLPLWATPRDLRDLETRIMSALSDKVDAIKAAVADMKARVQADIDDLKQKIADGAAPPEILTELDDIKTSIDQENPIPSEPAP